jgi:CRISPR-associated protein Csm3
MRIGGSSQGIKIGGIDLSVIRDAFDRPYIPGSSLKGKMRSLYEASKGKIADASPHNCENKDCLVCKIFGSKDLKDLTRIAVRDTALDETSLEGHPITEVKTETAIDRVEGKAKHGSLRQVERVPAGARFKDGQIVLNVYEGDDESVFVKEVFGAMKLLQDDYLGGSGSRGYGRVRFDNVRVTKRECAYYTEGKEQIDLTEQYSFV